jgi:predicted DNA binding CopG/RHH family protein
MARRQSRHKLDRSEQRIENSLRDYRPTTPAERDRILKAAGKTKTISLRLNEAVLENLRQKAIEDGLPYQTLISSILYRFSSGRLIDARAIRQVLGAIK